MDLPESAATRGITAEEWHELTRVGEELRRQIEEEDDPAAGFEFIERFVAAYEAVPGETIESAVALEGVPVGFRVSDLRKAPALIRAVVCENQECRREVEAAISSGLSAVAGVILAALAAGPLAVILGMMAMGMAAVLVVRGVDEVCEQGS